MRPLILSLGALTLVLSAAWAQNAGGGGTVQQLPVGQTFKNFVLPIYQGSKLRYTLTAAEATGITQNRAETTDLKIEIYDNVNGAVTTTVTSPKADLYVNEQKMRTKNTVHIVRSNMDATSQICDFDVITKKYVMRTNVKVILKNFDLNLNPGATGSTATSTHGAKAPNLSTAPAPAPRVPRSSLNNDSMLDSPGAYSGTNSAPLPPTSTDTK